MSAPAGEITVPARRFSGKLILLLTLLLGADQISKFFVRGWLRHLESVDVISVLRFQHVRNNGIAFGLLDGYASIVITVGIIVVVVIVVATLLMSDRQSVTWPLALLLAGSCGNLIDRLFFGNVTDFIRLPYWPAFNLADIFIVTGVVLLVYQLFLRDDLKARA